MAELMVYRDVLRQFSKLPLAVQRKIPDFIERFQKDPADPALHLHALQETMKDPKVRGADLPNGYRAIVIAPQFGDTYLLVHVDKHDDAYAWAKNKQFEVHGKTGVFQVFDAEAAPPVVKEAAPAVSDYPLAKLSDEELYQAGVPKPLISAVRTVSSDQDLLALGDYLPPDSRDVLIGIASGMTLDEALEEMIGVSAKERDRNKPKNAGDFSQISQTPNFDLVLIHDEETFMDMLRLSLEQWRVFLHPYQKKLVEYDTVGALGISGTAGTGKTVVLMHRAVCLARKLSNPKAKILVTTFTTNLSVTIKYQIRALARAEAERIEVTNLHALARTICTRNGWNGRIANEEEVTDAWQRVWDNPALGELPMAREELMAEFRLVVEPNGIDDEDTYLTTIRSGRPRISREQRRKAWQIFTLLRRDLKRQNLLTFDGAIHEARLASENKTATEFTHVLVDEVQDFSLEALRLIRTLSPLGDGAPNPLCVVGDGHQRIYRARIPLSRAGIDVRGRSRRLKINYRTSEQIREFAHSILKGVSIDNLDDGDAVTAGDHSVFRGPKPDIVACVSRQEEAKKIVEWVRHLMNDHSLASHEICIASTTGKKPDILTALTAASLPIFQLQPRQEDPGAEEPGVRYGTIKRIKGLEFRAVALACADPGDAMNRLEDASLADRCERYVGASRAREYLLVTMAGK